MKLTQKLTAVLTVLVLLLGALAGCVDPQASTPTTDPATDPTTEPTTDPYEGTGAEGMTAELKQEVEDLWLENTGYPLRWYTDNYYVGVRYYGTFDGYHLLFRETGSFGFVMTLGEYTFEYDNAFDIWILSEDSFDYLDDAYYAGAVEKELVAAVAAYHNERYQNKLEQENSAQPEIIEVEPLTEEKYREINEAYRLYAPRDNQEWTSDNYYGTYGNNIILFQEIPYFMAEGYEILAGYVIQNPCVFLIYVYNDGTFTQAYDAYEMGILTDEDVESIVNYHYQVEDWLGYVEG